MMTCKRGRLLELFSMLPLCDAFTFKHAGILQSLTIWDHYNSVHTRAHAPPPFLCHLPPPAHIYRIYYVFLFLQQGLLVLSNDRRCTVSRLAGGIRTCRARRLQNRGLAGCRPPRNRTCPEDNPCPVRHHSLMHACARDLQS